MAKRVYLLFLMLAAGIAPSGAGESAGAKPETRAYNEMGPATRVAPLRRRTSVDTPEPEPRGGGRAQVRLTIPSAGNRGGSRPRIVESREDGKDGSLVFDLANGVAPDFSDIPGVFTPDMMAADPSTPTMDMAFAGDSLHGIFPDDGLEVLAPMTLPESRTRLASAPVHVELPPPLGGPDQEQAILSAMAAPAMDPDAPDPLPRRMPPSSVRLDQAGPANAGQNMLLPPPPSAPQKTPSPADEPVPAGPALAASGSASGAGGGNSLRPPPGFTGTELAYPDPGPPLSKVRGRFSGPSPAAPQLPAEVDGFIPMREVRHIVSREK